MRAVVSFLETTLQDLRFGARLLRRSPWFTLVAVASLAIGLGAGVGLFGFMNAVLLRALPGRDTASLQAIFTSDNAGRPWGRSSWSDVQSFTTTVPPLFSAACATTNVQGNLAAGPRVHALHGALVNGGCFDALRVHPAIGRLLGRADGADGAPPAVVISDAFWGRAFGRDPDVVGRAVALSGVPATIVGVAERGFAGLSFDVGADFWVSAPFAATLVSPDVLTSRSERRFAVYARLDDGVTARLASDRLAGVAAALRAADPDAWSRTSGAARTVTVARELDARFATEHGIEAAIATSMLGAIAAIVAMACVNLATMTVARGAARARELNVRLAIGASRRRLLRQLATESLLISAAGGAAGLALVATALRVFDTYRPAEVPAFNLAIDGRVIAFLVLMALVAPVLFGLAPGAHALRLAIAEGVKGRVAMRHRVAGFGPRELLLAVQVVVSFALLVMASLFTRSLTAPGAHDLDPASSLVTVSRVELGPAARTETERRSLTGRLLEAVARVPGVERATAAAVVPLTGSSIGITARAGAQSDSPVRAFDANFVAPGYLELAGIRTRIGRTFETRDDERGPRVAVVSESLARELWGNVSAIGSIIRRDDGPLRVVGVVEDSPYRSVDGPQPVLYLPMAQWPDHRWVLHAQLSARSDVLAGPTMIAIDRAMRDVDARVILDAPRPLSQLVEETKIEARFAQWAGGAAGLLQLGLALMAIWGLVAYAVERRTAEFAIRRALGATDGSIVRLVMRPSLRLLITGGLAGGVAGIVGAQALLSTFQNLAPLDLTAMIPVVGLFAAVVLFAAWWPARRAVSIAPAAALKQS